MVKSIYRILGLFAHFLQFAATWATGMDVARLEHGLKMDCKVELNQILAEDTFKGD